MRACVHAPSSTQVDHREEAGRRHVNGTNDRLESTRLLALDKVHFERRRQAGHESCTSTSMRRPDREALFFRNQLAARLNYCLHQRASRELFYCQPWTENPCEVMETALDSSFLFPLPPPFAAYVAAPASTIGLHWMRPESLH
ncbi:hypothetical protein BHE74_00009222 [Ensete ventricosum]|nr:hypothetical protein BHE74_00009222 [Ensete ventricosum]